ncbi:hypothetical protein [Fodinicola feengrottensis]|uniref:hypothetical protein n=1 Tax=Fodinicola feengrottensis TaxID=435914 RepID=UPI0013D44E96|nr:hypothetical protein [Fodinicola feengrottensis]
MPTDRDVRLDITGLRALMELRTGVPSDALALLLPALPDVPADRPGAVAMAADALW